ncbi:MAG: hypothetical protein NTV79_09545 [Candidatus Aureabacteria bacterium]|nr:hypothetical protein [Candidatus Auribacterota bacterium]
MAASRLPSPLKSAGTATAPDNPKTKRVRSLIAQSPLLERKIAASETPSAS